MVQTNTDNVFIVGFTFTNIKKYSYMVRSTLQNAPRMLSVMYLKINALI